jgi:hypothetical protein
VLPPRQQPALPLQAIDDRPAVLPSPDRDSPAPQTAVAAYEKPLTAEHLENLVSLPPSVGRGLDKRFFPTGVPPLYIIPLPALDQAKLASRANKICAHFDLIIDGKHDRRFLCSFGYYHWPKYFVHEHWLQEKFVAGTRVYNLYGANKLPPSDEVILQDWIPNDRYSREVQYDGSPTADIQLGPQIPVRWGFPMTLNTSLGEAVQRKAANRLWDIHFRCDLHGKSGTQRWFLCRSQNQEAPMWLEERFIKDSDIFRELHARNHRLIAYTPTQSNKVNDPVQPIISDADGAEYFPLQSDHSDEEKAPSRLKRRSTQKPKKYEDSDDSDEEEFLYDLEPTLSPTPELSTEQKSPTPTAISTNSPTASQVATNVPTTTQAIPATAPALGGNSKIRGRKRRPFRGLRSDIGYRELGIPPPPFKALIPREIQRARTNSKSDGAQTRCIEHSGRVSQSMH